MRVSSRVVVPPELAVVKRLTLMPDAILLALYRLFIQIPALLIHPPFVSDRPIADLVDAGGYTQFGGIDVRVPLDVMRNLHMWVDTKELPLMLVSSWKVMTQEDFSSRLYRRCTALLSETSKTEMTG